MLTQNGRKKKIISPLTHLRLKSSHAAFSIIISNKRFYSIKTKIFAQFRCLYSLYCKEINKLYPTTFKYKHEIRQNHELQKRTLLPLVLRDVRSLEFLKYQNALKVNTKIKANLLRFLQYLEEDKSLPYNFAIYN